MLVVVYCWLPEGLVPSAAAAAAALFAVTCICQQSGLYVIQVQGVMYRSTRHMLLPYLMLNFPRLCVPLIAAGNQHPISMSHPNSTSS